MSISVAFVLALVVLLTVPLGAAYYLKLPILHKVVTFMGVAFAAMIVGGLVLKWLYAWDNALLNVVFVVLMTAIGAWVVTRCAHLNSQKHMVPVMGGMLGSLIFTSMIVVIAVLKCRNPLQANVFIPLSLMLIGCMIYTNWQGLAAYYMGLIHRGELYKHLIGNGATHAEALRFFVRRAMEKVCLRSVKQTFATMLALSAAFVFATSFSEMTVFQAVCLLIVLVCAGFCASVLSLLLTLLIARKYSFDEYGQLKQ